MELQNIQANAWQPAETGASTSTASNSSSKVAVQSTTLSERGTLSGVASFAYSYQLSELSLSSNETSFTYRQDNSLALRASSSTNFRLKTEQITFDVTMTAESLGLTAADFVDPAQPIQIKLNYSQSDLAVHYQASAKTVKTLREPQEILRDLVNGVAETLGKRRNATMRYELDAEAVQSLLQSGPEVAKAFYEILMIMNAINMMKKQAGSEEESVIKLSGKGNTYLDVQEETSGEMVQSSYEFNITILPPGSTALDSASGDSSIQAAA